MSAAAKPRRVSTLTFKVDGEYITHLARQLWVEKRFDKAIKILMTYHGMTLDIADSILMGRKKLKGVNEKTKLADDNATECCGIKLRPRAEVEEARRKKEVADERAMRERHILEREERDREEEAGRHQEELANLERDFATDGTTDAVRHYASQSGDAGLLAALNSGGIENATSFLEMKNRFLAPYYKKTEPPKAEKDMSSPFGWIDREGRFFACEGYGGHIQLALDLGFTEGQLEEQGWLKVCLGTRALIVRDFDFLYASKLRLTDAQWSRIEDWCLHHKRELPSREYLEAQSL